MLENTTSNAANTELVAYIGAVTGIIGALTGTIALGWNFYKHHLDTRVQLFVNVVESYVGGETQEVRAEIINNGSTPVTIRDVLLESHFQRRQRYGVAHQMKDPASAIPTKLDSGGIIFAKIELDAQQLIELGEHGELAVAVHHSRSKKPHLEFYDSPYSPSANTS